MFRQVREVSPACRFLARSQAIAGKIAKNFKSC